MKVPLAISSRKRERAFALVVALAMVALVVLVILASSLMVKVDTAGSVQLRSQAEARQNALAGLHRALGDLQAYAGPDQRTTARSDILSNNNNELYWTGVWNTAPSSTGTTPFERGTEPVWLVSSTSTPNPLAGPTAGRSIELVRNTPAGRGSVAVEKIALSGTGAEARGEFAYWVGDEGIKANIAAAEPDTFKNINPASVEQIRRLNGAHQAAWEAMAGAARRVSGEEAAKLNSLESISMIDGFSNDRTHFHDLTAASVSLLTNVKNGGMKEDLSRILSSSFNANAAYSSTAKLLRENGSDIIFNTSDPTKDPTWGLLRSFYMFGLQAPAAGQLSPTLPVQPQTDTVHGIAPLVTMVQMNWTVRRASSAPAQNKQFPLVFGAQPIVAIANPYNVTLASTSYVVRVRHSNSATSPVTLTLKAGGNSASVLVKNSFETVSPQNEWLLLKIPATSFAPGEAKIFSLPSSGSDISYSTGGVTLAPGVNQLDAVTFGPATSFSITEGDKVSLELTWGEVRIQLYQGSNRLQDVQNVYYATSVLKDYDVELGGSAIPCRMIMRDSARNVVARGGTPTRQDHESGARWLALYNPRVPVSERDPDGAWVSNPIYQGLWNAAGEPDSYTVAHSGANAYWGASSNGNQTHCVLFNIPRRPIISLGAFQHANLAPNTWFPAYAFGNSWASPYAAFNARDFSYVLNEHFWDRYFLSGLPDSLAAWPAPGAWENPRLFPLQAEGVGDALDYRKAGMHLGLRGGFNINSTSVHAWTSLLQSLQGQQVPVVDAITKTTGTTATNSNIPFLRNSLASGPAGNLWRGFRVLTPAELERLAREIVAVIREKGPFRSLSAFVNRDLQAAKDSEFNLKGALQAAIDRSEINTSAAGNAPWDLDPVVPPVAKRSYQTGDTSIVNLAYPEASTGPRSTAAPGFITQADLLTLLGPAITARSDTFLIRAYGNTLNRATEGVEAEVWCEAVVQRISEYINSGEAADQLPLLPVNQRFGRKFRIVSFRWLSPDEL